MASDGLETEDKEALAPATDGEDVQRGKKRSAESPSPDQDDQLKPTPAKLQELDEATPRSEADGASCSSESIDKEAKFRATTTGPAEYAKGKPHSIVDQESQVEPALEKLRNPSVKATFLAVDCEGEQLSRRWKLSVVSVGTESHTYVFDIKALGAVVFDKGLRDLLEDPNQEKLMFDCRQDSDCLWNQFKVKLANVLDLQLMQAIYRETHPEPEDTSRRPRSARNSIKDQPRARGLLYCLKTYVKDEKLIKAKEDGKSLMHLWMGRPLGETLLKYAAADIESFFKVYHELKQCVDDSAAKARLQQASQKYLDFFKSREERLYDRFECNSFLPWRILPEYAGSRYCEETMCVECKRRFPRRDFSKTQLSKGVQRCPVCKRQKEEDDIADVRCKYYEKCGDDYDDCVEEEWGSVLGINFEGYYWF